MERTIGAKLAFIAFAIITQLLLASSFVVESWYVNLNHFGPLANDGWNARPMTLIANYTYRISNLSYLANQPYMFVSSVPPPVPPLGDKNWKQGKIGMKTNTNTGGVLQPGGAAGYVPFTGVYTMTLRTPAHPTAPNTLEYQITNAQPGVWVESVRSVTSTPTVMLEIRFSEAVIGFSSQKIKTTNAQCSSNSRSLGRQSDGSFLFTVSCTIQNVGVATFDLAAGAASSVAAPPRNTSVAPTWSILFTRSMGLTQANFGPLFTLRDKSRPGYPSGGYYVAAMHANFIPALGQVLLSGTGRRGGETCFGGLAPGDRRAFDVSFLLDPRTLRGQASNITVQPIPEDAEYRIRTPVFNAAVQPTSGTYDGLPITGDVIYCSGHTTMLDGKVFFTGGARYAYLSSPLENEWGLDYSRIFDPESKVFKAVRNSVSGNHWAQRGIPLQAGYLTVALW